MSTTFENIGIVFDLDRLGIADANHNSTFAVINDAHQSITTVP
jgi:hypothetical protein